MAGDSSSGKMHLVYEDLKIKVIDRDNHGVSPSDYLRGLFSNTVRPEIQITCLMPMTKCARSQIEHVREPDSPFFQHLWYSLRSGILDIVMRM
jgi:hypothetical protein